MRTFQTASKPANARCKLASPKCKLATARCKSANPHSDASPKKLGWAGRAERSSTPAPEQVRNLEAVNQGPGWLKLDWKAPNEGGKPVSYRIESFNRDTDTWKEVASTLDRDTILVVL